MSMLGFSVDGLQQWSTQNPLRWNIYHPNDPGHLLVDTHVNLGPLYRRLRAADPLATDFQLMDRILRQQSQDGSPAFGSAIAEEVRNYLALSLSYFQLRLVDANTGTEYPRFPWSRWLRYYAKELSVLVSFNYDLVLERFLQAAGIGFFRPGVVGQDGSLPLIKPHGSIDLGPHGFDGVRVINSDVPQRLLLPDEMLEHRREHNIVLPGEVSELQHLQWLKAGMMSFRTIAPSITDVVLLGLSYWPADQVELDSLLLQFPKSARIVVANPAPHEAWTKSLEETFRHVVHWPDGPEEL